MKYLGIDYGKRKMGLAISEGISASPFKVIEISSLEDGLEKIKHVIRKEEIEKVVVGMPESGEARIITEKFVEHLGLGIEVEAVDETLTSQQATNYAIAQNVSQKRRKENEDAYAASLILQNFLDNLRN